MEIRENYERALRDLNAFSSKYKSGTKAELESKRASLIAEMVKHRNKLVADGLWEGPRPMNVKRKYRG